MARRVQRQGSPNYTIIAVLGAVAVVGVIFFVWVTSARGRFVPVTERMPEERRKTIADDLDKVKLDDPTQVSASLPPHQRVFRLLFNARKKVCIKDLQTALSMCEEALKTDPAYAGDVYFSMALCHKNHAAENELPYADQIEHSRKSLEYYGSAREAYKQPGAKTGFPETPERRAGRITTIMKWEKSAQESWQRQIEAGVLRPPAKGR